MRVAGVQLDDGGRIWVDAAEWELAVRDRVRVRADDQEVEGWIFVAPEQFIVPPGEVEGQVLERCFPPLPDGEVAPLPGADLPPLGTIWTAGDITGPVVALDPVSRTVTVEATDGTAVVVSLGPEAAHDERRRPPGAQ